MSVDMQRRVGNLLNDDNFNEVIAYGVLNNIDPKQALNRIVEEWVESKNNKTRINETLVNYLSNVDEHIRLTSERLKGIEEKIGYVSTTV